MAKIKMSLCPQLISIIRHGQLSFMYVWSNNALYYEGWNFNSGNYLFTTDTK